MFTPARRRIEPGPGQESVWDYPRPPRVEDVAERVVVKVGDVVLADTTSAKRVLETSHPPVYYVPPEDVNLDALTRNDKRTSCEYKGRAAYYDLSHGGRVARDVAWFYPEPAPQYSALKDHLAFYPSKAECSVGGEVVDPQEGDFYGGWKTSKIVGPFKGGPGTTGW